VTRERERSQMTATPVPERIHRTDNAVTITWNENHVAAFSARDLRLRCQCAECRDEMTGYPLLDPDTVSEDIAPLTISLVGAYAIKIDWSDGHSTGIYAFDALAAICPCKDCVTRRGSRDTY
jgi:ATP-binding protein involved in chromosome partitioning